MTKPTVIVGAGLAGLLAGNMLRRSPLTILEAQKQLPHNHHAVLRFRTDKVALQTGIRFRRVSVFKAIHDSINPVADALAYSHKVTGRLQLRSIIDTAPVQRYIAPPDLIPRMAEGLPIQYGQLVDGEQLKEMARDCTVISTMPMQALMDLLGYEGPRPEFAYRAGSVIKVPLQGHDDVFATIYYPHSSNNCRLETIYRASITGNELAIELVRSPPSPAAARGMVREVLATFGLPTEYVDDLSAVQSVPQPYAKIVQLSDEDRQKARDFMYWATVTHGIYSLGRFATWRPGLLLDDVVDDVAKIEGWSRSGSLYSLKKEI